MRKTIMICLIMSFLSVLSGCSGVYTGDTVSIISNKDSIDTFAKITLTEGSYNEYLSALTEQEKRSHYIDIEEEYHKAVLQYYNDFTEAYNLGIIDENGVPTGTYIDNTFIVEKYSKEDLITKAKEQASKEDLLKWLTEQRWITEGPDLEDNDNKYLDVLFSEFELAPSLTIGFTKESLASASFDDIITWLSYFYDLEKGNVDYYRQNVAQISEEELQNKINYLLGYNYVEPVTDRFISVIDGRHVITENTIKSFGKTNNQISVKVMNNTFVVDISTLGKPVTYGSSYECITSEDGKSVIFKINVNGTDEVFTLPIDESVNKVNMSKYEIYRLLGMKIYV